MNRNSEPDSVDSEFSKLWFSYAINNPNIYERNEYLSCNKNLTWEIIQNYRYNWCYDILSWNPNITWEIIKKDLSSKKPKPWSFKNLSFNPNITWENIQEAQVLFPSKKWCFKNISMNPNITWDIIKKDLSSKKPKPWCFLYLSRNPNITWENVQEAEALFPDKKWYYNELCRFNPNITWKIVKASEDLNLGKNWNYTYLLENPSTTWEDIKDITSRNITISEFAANHNITWEIIQANPELPWNYIQLQSNPNIPWEIIKVLKFYIDPKRYNDKLCSRNPNISPEIIESNDVEDLKISWDWDSLAINPMTGWKNEFIMKRNQKRCAIIKDELINKTYQAGYFFKNCLSEEELGFDEEFLREAAEKYPVKF